MLQGARGNDGAAGAAGPPVSFQFLDPKLSYSLRRRSPLFFRLNLFFNVFFQGPTGPSGPSGFPGGPGAKV